MSSRILPVTFFAAVLFLSSCGGGEEKAKTDTSGDTTATTTSAPPAEVVAPSTIVSSPQNMIQIRHKVGNFAKFIAGYEAHDSLRLASGIHSYVIGRGVQDSNTVLVATKADDMEKAKAFGKSTALKDAMKKVGVTGSPSIKYTIMIFQDTGVISSDLRSMTTFSVKDWDAWQNGFKEGKQERIDNGIVDRAYGHDPDDNKKVTLVTAIMDTAKASAYWKSDMLKKRREAGGVIGTPERFVFRVVKRY